MVSYKPADRHHLDLGSSSFSIFIPCFVVFQKNEEMKGRSQYRPILCLCLDQTKEQRHNAPMFDF